MMSPDRRDQLTRDLSPEEKEHLSATGSILVPMDDWLLLIVDKVVTMAIERHARDCPFRQQADRISTKATIRILGACGALAAAIYGGMAAILGAIGK